jgi:2-C-methyl-D-erythritol 4-phosphate cytidylyltransferase/2-C-methyl-D-erythritol 2,4-cyclodiphosphate synthase
LGNLAVTAPLRNRADAISLASSSFMDELVAMRIAALLVAAGSGTRFGSETPKQFLPLAGVPIIRRAAEALLAEVDVLLPVGDAAMIGAALAGLPHLPAVPGGRERQDSVLAGLEALVAAAPDIVLVHDAARPVIPPGTIAALLTALERADGAIPALAVADTLKRGEHSIIVGTVPRAGLFRYCFACIVRRLARLPPTTRHY